MSPTDIVCPRCHQTGVLYRYDDSDPRPGKTSAAYVLHDEPRRVCLLRRVDLEKGVPQKCI